MQPGRTDGPPKYGEQRDEIGKVMERLGISKWEDLHARIPQWDRETVRKAVQGSQKVSRQMMIAIHQLTSYGARAARAEGVREVSPGLELAARDWSDAEIIKKVNDALTDDRLTPEQRVEAAEEYINLLRLRAMKARLGN